MGTCTVEVDVVDCRNSPALTGRWLGAMGTKEAALELLEHTDLKQQRQVLMQMKPHGAAALLEVPTLHPKLMLPMLSDQDMYS